MTVRPKPFLKWVGSKYRYIEFIAGLAPISFNRYIEPFLGSGALFFHAAPTKAILSDINNDLVRTYQSVRDYPEEVSKKIDSIPTDKDTYYYVRANRSDGDIDWAAEFIYLNQLCWNGLYRVNLAGKFNVPYGARKSKGAIDTSAILACSQALKRDNVELLSSDFEEVCDRAQAGDFLFIDPPYVTSHNNNGFIEYNEKIFSWADQIRLERVCRKLHERGVRFLLTNAHHEDVVNIYEGFVQKTFSRFSTLAADKNFRKPTTELVVTNYEGH